jgi:hypothetical protein
MVRLVLTAVIDLAIGLMLAGVVATAVLGIHRSAPLDSPAWLWGVAGGWGALGALVHYWVSGRRTTPR